MNRVNIIIVSLILFCFGFVKANQLNLQNSNRASSQASHLNSDQSDSKTQLNETAITHQQLISKSIIPLYNIFHFVGTLTSISDGAYITAAHVLTALDETTLRYSILGAGIKYSDIKIYRLISNLNAPDNTTLDVAIVIDTSKTNIESALALLRRVSGRAALGNSYTVKHVYETEGNSFAQLSHGPILISEDLRFIFLADNANSLMSFGSSGSIVWYNQSGSRHYKIAGLLQCLVKPSSSAVYNHTPKAYFRALTIDSILNTRYEEVSLERFKQYRNQFLIDDCKPTGNEKDGGGG